MLVQTALLVLPELRDQLVPQEMRVPPDIKANKAQLVRTVLQVLQVLQVLRAPLVLKELPVL
jgi:hypothetical protein